MAEDGIEPLLRRVADALDRLAPAEDTAVALADADAYVWHAADGRAEPIGVPAGTL